MKEEKEKDKDRSRLDGNKYSIKTSFRTLQVMRLASHGVIPPQDPIATTQHLSFSFTTKEKKQRSKFIFINLFEVIQKFIIN